MILYSKPHLLLLWRVWSGLILNVEPLASRAAPKVVSALTALFSWQNAYAVGVKTVCLYNIHSAHAFSFWFVIPFSCPLVYTGAYLAYEISYWRVCHRSISNTKSRYFRFLLFSLNEVMLLSRKHVLHWSHHLIKTLYIYIYICIRSTPRGWAF